MAQQHTTPERSLAAAYAHQERAAGVGQESRLKKDPCYQLYEESLRCLDENDYDRGLCAEAFAVFKACRSRQKNVKAGAEEGASNLERMLKAQEKDPLLGPIMRGWRMARDAVSSALEPSEQPQEQQLLEPEPEWKVAKRQREEARQLEQRMQELQAAFEQQREEQRQQQWFWRRWFGKQ